MKTHVWCLLVFKYNSKDKISIWMIIIPIFLGVFFELSTVQFALFKSCCFAARGFWPHHWSWGHSIETRHGSLRSKSSQNLARIQSKYSLVLSKAVLQKCVQMLLWAPYDPHLWWPGLSVTLVSVLSLLCLCSDLWAGFAKHPGSCAELLLPNTSQSPAWEGCTR